MTEPNDPNAVPPPPPPPLAPLVGDQQAPVAPGDEVPPPPSPAAPAAPAKPPSKLRTYLIVGAIVALVGVVLYVVKDSQSAFDLAVGQCFDVPGGDSNVSTVTKHECTEPHDAEVFFVGDYPNENTYPGEAAFDTYVETNCVPAFTSYVGISYLDSEDYTFGWFYPTPDSWDEGDDREISCYVTRLDETKLSQSVKAAS